MSLGEDFWRHNYHFLNEYGYQLETWMEAILKERGRKVERPERRRRLMSVSVMHIRTDSDMLQQNSDNFF